VGQLLHATVGALNEFNDAVTGITTHNNPPGNTDEIGVFELHASPFLAVIE
jgi:hypothetical protein